jgi:hypothetical protein
MPRKPIVAVLIPQPTRAQVLSGDVERRLASMADVFSPFEPDPNQWDLKGLLAEADACLTGWGTPSLPDALLARSPALKL